MSDTVGTGAAPPTSTPTVTTFSPRAFRWQRRRAAAVDFWARFRGDRLALLGALVLLAFIVMAITAPWISPKGGLSAVDSIQNPTWASPRSGYPMGTDNLGRSVAAQFVWGSRVSLWVGLSATVLTIAIGSVVGVTAGFFGKWTDAALMRLTDWFLVIPFLPLAIVLASVLSRSLRNVILVIAITTWPGTARLVRSQVLTVKQRLYVDRARSLGASGPHIVRHHILPNVSGLIMANATLAVPISILTESTLAFLGLGDVRRLVLAADVALVADAVEVREQEGVVDLARTRFVAPRVVGDLDVRDARDVLAHRRRQFAFIALRVVDVVLQEEVVRAHFLDDRDRLVGLVEPEARDVVVVDRFDQQLDAHFLQRGGGKTQVLDEGLAQQCIVDAEPLGR